MLGSLGWQELLLVLAIVALLAGGSRVADLGGQLGRGMREFRKELRSDDTAKDEPPAAEDKQPAGQAVSRDRSEDVSASDADTD